MPDTRSVAKGKAILLGGLAGSAVLCTGLSLLGFALLFVALFYLDDHSAGGSDAYYSTVFLGVTLALVVFVALRFGWKVGRDWYRNGHRGT
jgi:hypothetical protein